MAHVDELTTKINVDAIDALQFVEDVKMLHYYALKLKHAARNLVALGPVALEASKEIERITVNLSKITLA